MTEYYSKFVEEVDDEEKNLIKKIEERLPYKTNILGSSWLHNSQINLVNE